MTTLVQSKPATAAEPSKKIIPLQNGLKGLTQNWKNDLLAGLVVSFVATPVSIGIAIASGAPPIAGLISAVVAGFVLPLIGGSYVTISGPAAGLAPVIYASILALSGSGNDMEMGFRLLLPVIFLVGLVQIILSQLKIAHYSKIFPLPVIEGMMASIGLMIIFKQIPLMMGHKFAAHEFWGIVMEVPSEFFQCTPKVFALGAFCLSLMTVLYVLRPKIKLLQTYPPQLFTVLIGTILGQFLFLDKKFLISLPSNPLANAMHLSNFQELFSIQGVMTTVPLLIITLTLIDGIESLATISAVDKIDPYRRKSNPDRTLLAMGCSNMVSSLAGGLTLIPEILRSSTNILAGGRTQWANFFCAACVLMYVLFFREQISLIPLTVLSAVVIYTGYSLCQPAIWKKIYKTGLDQFFIYIWTIYITVTYDLMWGIISGVVVSIFINGFNYLKKMNQAKNAQLNVLEAFGATFKSPVAKVETNSGEAHIYLDKPIVSTNYIHILQKLTSQSSKIKTTYLHISDEVQVADATALEYLLDYIQDYNHFTEARIMPVGLHKINANNFLTQHLHYFGVDKDQLSVSG